MNNTRFATVMHILTLLADTQKEWISSDWIAKSVNINPVVVRRELSILRNAGLVVSRKGKEGGTMLGSPSTAISLAEIYLTVKNTEVLGKKNVSPNPKCPIGRKMNENLEKLFTETDQLVIDMLSHKTLADFVKQFH